jgi:hypothetical protein
MSIDPSFWQGAKRAPRTVRQRAPGGRESRAFHMPRPERHPNLGIMVTIKAQTGRCLARFGHYVQFREATQKHAFDRLPHAHLEIESVTVSERTK